MFDWNDEELSNIIWDEAGEGEDQIVPYPDSNEGKSLDSYGDCIKKEHNQDAVDTKLAEQKKPVTQTELDSLDCSSGYETNEGLPATEFTVNSWPDLSLPRAAETDQDAMGTEAPDNVTELSKHDPRTDDKTAPLDNNPEIFESPLDDSEQGDLVDYGWASVGSFEDLDRIFSNEDPIFGHGNLGNADELWSSSKDLTSSAEKSIPLSSDSPSLELGTLRSTSEQFDVQGEYLSVKNQCFTLGYEKLNLFTSNVPQDVKSGTENIEYAGSNIKISTTEKTAFGSTLAYNLQLDTGTVAATNEYMNKRSGVILQVLCSDQLESNRIAESDQRSGTFPVQQRSFYIGSDLHIFHLFADDTLIFCGNDSQQIKHLRCLFLCFEAVTGLKGNKQKLLKGRKQSEEKSEVRHLQNLQGWTQAGNQFLQYDRSYAPNVGQPSSSLLFSQQTQLQGPESLHNKHFSNPNLTSLMHGNIAKQYSAMPVLSQFHSRKGSQQPALSNYEVPPGNLNPLNQSTQPPVKSLKMTPQEKIEKLRRRQQMRAMLAIQKQQQQFNNQVSCTDYSVMEGEITEAEGNLATLTFLDPNSPIEQDDSSTIRMAHDDYSGLDSILYQLQAIVAKLDMRIRLCIRDSLFRLAQSATRRQYSSDTSSSNTNSRDEVLSKEEINSHNRFPKVSEVETETNPIDRTVAHLLFHRPLEFSGKLVETPDSHLSAKLLLCERKASSSTSLLTNSLPHSYENMQKPSHEESDNAKTGLDAPENTSYTKAADNAKMKVEASH